MYMYMIVITNIVITIMKLLKLLLRTLTVNIRNYYSHISANGHMLQTMAGSRYSCYYFLVPNRI